MSFDTLGYDDREDAGMALLPYVEPFMGKDGVVVAIPRGGVPVGKIIAGALGWPLLPLIIKKIGHPENPEFAIGYVTSKGHWVDPDFDRVPINYIENEVERIRALIDFQSGHYRMNALSAVLTGKTVILVDDGMATGNSILAGIRLLRKMNPAEIIVMVPVAAPDAANRVEMECDALVCPLVPDDFLGVGQYYRSFPQLKDEVVWKMVNGD